MNPVLVALSWLIGIANCASAVLVGPMLAWLLKGYPATIRRAQGIGWLVLFTGQAAFWVFGFKSGFPGFQYAQPWMIPISFCNFMVWLLSRPPRRDAATLHALSSRSRARTRLRVARHA